MFTVGILSHFFPPDHGGIPRIHSYTVAHYPELGIRPIVLTRKSGRRFERLSMRGYPTVRLAEYGNLFEAASAARQGRFGGTDPFEQSGFRRAVSAVAEKAVDLFRKQDVSLVNSHIFADLSIGIEIAEALDIPHVHVGHAAYRRDAYVRKEAERLGTNAPIVSQEQIKRALRSCRVDTHVVHTEYVRRKYIELGVHRDKIEVVPPGVDLSAFRREGSAARRLRRRLGLTDEILLTCPSLRKHGFDLLLAAVARLRRTSSRGVHLVCCDIETMPSCYADLARSLGIADHVTCGSFPDRMMAALYSASDAVVLCSTEEGIGLPVLEARACGTPVVAHRFGPFVELVHDREDGYLVEPGDTDALAATIEEAATDSASRRQVIRQGLDRVRAYSHHLMAPRYARIFRDTASRSRN